MDADIFRDLKQLDERLQTAKELLKSCTNLFKDHYRETVDDKPTYSWPYSIKGDTADIEWPTYEAIFPQTPKLSPSTMAICGWAVCRLSGPGSEAEKKLFKFAAQAATELAKLPIDRLTSKTFTGPADEIFVDAQVLRFLASQAQFKGELFSHVFGRVQTTINDPASKLHPFLLHYCVLAREQVRRPAIKLADSMIAVCDLDTEVAKLQEGLVGAQSITMLTTGSTYMPPRKLLNSCWITGNSEPCWWYVRPWIGPDSFQ